MEKLLKFGEVAKQIGVHRETLRKWINKGKGPEIIIFPGGRMMVSPESLKVWREGLNRIEPQA